jgi:hypothetical protein
VVSLMADSEITKSTKQAISVEWKDLWNSKIHSKILPTATNAYVMAIFWAELERFN